MYADERSDPVESFYISFDIEKKKNKRLDTDKMIDDAKNQFAGDKLILNEKKKQNYINIYKYRLIKKLQDF